MPSEGLNPSRGRVLLVDDEESIQLSVGELLRRRGFEVAVASSGSAALALLQQSPFEALIADIHMPGNAGLELVETISRAIPGLPTVLLTGRPSVESAARSVRLSVAAYLMKPPDLDELSEVLDEAITGFRAVETIRAYRSRLKSWDRDLAEIERALEAGMPESETDLQRGFLSVSLRQMLLILGDLEKSVRALETSGAASIQEIAHVAALRHTVQVLQRTKQNFKSKDLAELRKTLEHLISDED